MTTCRCADHDRPVLDARAPTVGEVSRDPAALAVLTRLGIDHCCGAHLSLGEGAAAAGVDLDELLKALADARGPG